MGIDDFNRGLMGFYSDLMGFYTDSMGFYTDSMGYEWDIPSGKCLHNELERFTMLLMGKSIDDTLW